MERDKRGYYARLDVPPTASASEIKAAYRHLVRQHHPDRGGSGSGQEIREINEAYHILGDPQKRASYDAESGEAQENRNDTLNNFNPLICRSCHKITAQPRYLIFRNVYSFLFFTTRVPVQGIFCAPCAKSVALKSTVITSLLGWWGIPWGPLLTLGNGFHNALGGRQDASQNDVLAWHNVNAFLQSNHIALAYGLAEKLLKSQNREIATAAAEITVLCRSNGFKPAGELKDPWGAVRSQAPLRLAILFFLPFVLSAFLVANHDPPPSRFEPEQREAASDYTSIDTAGGFELDQPSAPVIATPLATCATPPSNGTVLSGAENLVSEGHVLEIDNGSSGNAIVKVRDAVDGSTYASFYIEQGQSASIEGIKDGQYEFQVDTGNELDSECSFFAGDITGSEFPDPEYLAKEYFNVYSGEGYLYQSLQYTLYSIPGGNVRPVTTSADEFNSD
ncbi:MAG: J domain-containing protein [Porphyrobacter sp.]|nr:J domain-containing protein [Porphyrobacter sp.]